MYFPPTTPVPSVPSFSRHPEAREPAPSQPEPREPRTAHVRLYGRILGDHDDDARQGESFRARYAVTAIRNAGTVDELHVHIDSPGGNFDGACAIIDALAARRERIVCHVEGLCWSAAFAIMAECKRRGEARSNVHSNFLVHDVHVAGCIAATRKESEWAAQHLARCFPEISVKTLAAWMDNRGGKGVHFCSAEAMRREIIDRWEFGPVRTYQPIADADRPFEHTGAHAPLACQCGECRLARSAPATIANRKREPIALPPRPVAGRFSLFALSVADLVARPASGPHDLWRETMKSHARGRLSAKLREFVEQ
jgi:ATP-dependent protease ClpP protease subunit